MNAGMDVCDECSHNCLLLHKRKNPSQACPLVASFFKVMIGDGFSEALYIPPTFAGKLSSLIGKETKLEDSTGRQWTVTLSKVDGDLAFQEGWHNFFLDHNVQFGDFLVFHYVMGLGHFVVQIYGKNGCEKLRYSEGGCVKNNNNPGKNKRSKFPSDLVTPNGLDNPLEKELITEEWIQNKRSEHSEGLANGNGNQKPVEKGSVSNRLADGSHSSGSIVPESHTHLEEPLMVVAQGSKWNNNSKKSDIVCAADYCDEPYLMLNRDVSFMGQDSRISAFDLSDFEMSDRKCPLQANCVPEGSRCPFDDPLARAQTDASLDGSEETGGEDEDDEMMDVTTTDGNIGSNAGTSLDSQNNYSVDKAVYRIVKGSWKKHESPKDMVVIPSTHALTHKEQVCTPSESTRKTQVAERTRSRSKFFDSLRSQKEHALTTDDSRQEKQQRKQGQLSDSSNSPLITAEIFKIVKEERTEWVQDQQSCELVACADFPPPLAVEVPCLVTTENETYLDLPRGLPLFVVRGRPRQKEQVVILQDPSMRLWPVFYHEKIGLSVLTDGWQAFRKANEIQSGDTCCFAPRNESDGVYSVRIIRQ